MQAIIHTPTPDLDASRDFYRRLGFAALSPGPPSLVSDGAVIVEIDPDRFARPGVKLYGESWTTVARSLAEITSVHKTDAGYLCADPSNVWIYLIEGESGPQPPSDEIPPSVLGTFAGLSLETADLARSTQMWELLEFLPRNGNISDGSIELTNEDGLIVTLMAPFLCPHLFFNPSLTYFNGRENEAVIEKIRQHKIPITEEITHFNDSGIVDNVIIRDPGGYGFFVFND